MECVTSTQGSPIATADPSFFLAVASAGFQNSGRLLPLLTKKKINNPKTIFSVFERRKITFRADDLCCVPVLNSSPTYWGPVDSSAIVGIARG